jgi:hypothetical protein
MQARHDGRVETVTNGANWRKKRTTKATAIMPKKRLVFQLVGISIIIIVISHMAYKYLSTPLATIRNQLNLVKLHRTLASATTNNNKWTTMSSDDYATVSYVTTPNEDVARQLSK